MAAREKMATQEYTWPDESVQSMHAASAQDAAMSLRKIARTLSAILGRLDALGVDGIHYILMHESAKRRKADKARRIKALNARRRRAAAKKAALGGA